MGKKSRDTHSRLSSYRTHWLDSTAAGALIMSVGLVARPALAQETPNAATTAAPAVTADATDAVQEIVVTGSRITRSDFNTPTPVTAFSQTEIQNKAIGSLVDLVTEIPQLAANSVPVGSTNPGSALLNLRGIGAQRTLLLVDGRRFAETSPTGGTDINVLPASLIKSVDVVTGGASAAYGSDAVAGVVEVTLDNKFEGFKGNLQAGESQYQDDRNLLGSLGWGTSFGDGRGHLVLATDNYYTSGQIQGNRPWGREAWGTLSNPGYPNNGQAQQLITPGIRLSEMTSGGVIVAKSGPLSGIQFGPGGQILPFQRGNYAGTTFMQGGNGGDISQQAAAAPEIRRDTGYGHLSFDFTPRLTGWVDALVGYQKASYPVIPSYDNGDILVTQQNAFLPAPVRQIMVNNNIPSFMMGRINGDLGWNLADGRNKTQRYGTGLDGQFGESWKWSTFLQYSRNEQLATDGNDLLTANWKNALNSVISPTTGQPVCASTLTNPNNGCVPVNPFGPNTVTQAVRNYVLGTQTWDETQTQSVAAANLSGEPISDWAGPVSVATGFEARHEATEGTSDPLSQQQAWRLVNAQPLNGSVSVEEGYVETVIPLLSHLPLVQNFEFNGAMRETHYSTSGWANTWKAGLNYSPDNQVRFRMTVSRDIRAPNTNELFTTRTQNIQPIADPTNSQVNQTLVVTGGNANLTPEVGRTVTGGVVFQPNFAQGLSVSLDYYHLTLHDAITTLAAQSLVDDCVLLHETSLCGGITRDPNSGVITQVFAQEFNAQEIVTEGYDFEAAYHFALNSLIPNAPGQLRLRGLATYVSHLTTTVNGVTTDTAGQVTSGGIPHWQGNLTATYDVAKFSFVTEARYVDGGLFNSTYQQGITINDNSLPSKTYVSLLGQYAPTDHLQVYARVSNLFNADPPIAPLAVQAPHAANSPFFDVVGRAFTLGVRFQY